jgi:hypothetical protein
MTQATPLTTKPYHQHDCAKCRYLGSMIVDGRGPADWYVCGNERTGSVIARFSDEGRDYWSMMPSMVNDPKYGHPTHTDDKGITRVIVSDMMILARYMLQQEKNPPK